MVYLRVLILAIFILLSKDIFAQKYEFGIAGYATSYMGDLNTNNLFYYSNFGGGVFAKYNLNETWGLRLNYNYLALSASDEDFKNIEQQKRNLSFENHISEISISGEFNFFKFNIEKRKKKYSPYLLAGLGLIIHNPFVNYGHQKIKLKELELERDNKNNPINYSSLALIMPLGLGFKYNIKGPWTIAAELNYRLVFSDNIDNVSGYYPEKITDNISLPTVNITTENGINRRLEEGDWYYLADPSNNFVTNRGKLRGNGIKWDGYMTTGIALSYTLKHTKCVW